MPLLPFATRRPQRDLNDISNPAQAAPSPTSIFSHQPSLSEAELRLGKPSSSSFSPLASRRRNIRQKLDECGEKLRKIVTGFGQRFEPHLPALLREEVKAFAEVADLFDEDFRKTIATACANQVTAYLSDNLPRIIEETDVWNIVYETIMGYDERKMEVLTREVANRELRGVTLWGGMIGAGVGLSMSILMWLMS